MADSGIGFGSGGSGKASLGLEIVDTLVRHSGGALMLGSSSLGGLAVTVTLPGAADPVRSLVPQQRGPAKGGPV